jgi:hypothetical protein
MVCVRAYVVCCAGVRANTKSQTDARTHTQTDARTHTQTDARTHTHGVYSCFTQTIVD